MHCVATGIRGKKITIEEKGGNGTAWRLERGGQRES
jgi:hypothetical protein